MVRQPKLESLYTQYTILQTRGPYIGPQTPCTLGGPDFGGNSFESQPRLPAAQASGTLRGLAR